MDYYCSAPRPQQPRHFWFYFGLVLLIFLIALMIITVPALTISSFAFMLVVVFSTESLMLGSIAAAIIATSVKILSPLP